MLAGSRSWTPWLGVSRLGKLPIAAALISRWHSGLFRFRGLVHPPAFDDGGAVMNQGIHAIDLLPSFLGEPERVSATH